MNDVTGSANPASGAPRRDAPGVIVFPPALYLATLLSGILLSYFWRWPLLPGSVSNSWFRIAGGVMIVPGLSLVIWGRARMMSAGTNVIPTRPALVIVTDGPFRFTRNPLYLGNLIVYAGLILVFNSAWLAILLIPMLLLLNYGIVQREERYLEAKFGNDYRAYKARVRRWL